ncbi:MAG: hypothetical protein V4719_06375 [Planctomycetota bacterium]
MMVWTFRQPEMVLQGGVMLDQNINGPVPTTRSVLPQLWWIRLGCLACLLSAVGCFEKTYADRMAVTVKLYDHLDLLNRNLSPDWMDSGFKLRTPVGFQYIPKPVPPKPDPNNPQATPASEEHLDDLRQPGYLGIKLPGLVSAWQKNVVVDEPNATSTRKAYIYLLSNVSLFGIPPETAGRVDPLKFQEHTVNLLAADLGEQFKEDDWRREEFPVGFKLVPKVTYDSLAFLPPERQFEETKMSFKLYITSQKDTQAILLFVYPDSTSATEKLGERIPLCLETLRLPNSAAASGTAAPGTAGPSGAPAF